MADKASKTLIKNVRIFDGTSQALQNGMNLLIEDNRIKQISPEPISTPVEHDVIDGKGHVLMPGMINSHYHMLGALPIKLIFEGPPKDYRVFWYADTNRH